MMDCDEQKFDALDDTPETVVAKQKPQLHEGWTGFFKHFS